MPSAGALQQIVTLDLREHSSGRGYGNANITFAHKIDKRVGSKIQSLGYPALQTQGRISISIFTVIVGDHQHASF
jgi:hypothetical protein